MSLGKIILEIFKWFFSVLTFGFYLIKAFLNLLANPPIPHSEGKSEEESRIDDRIYYDKLFNKTDGLLKDDLAKGRVSKSKVEAFGGGVKPDDFFQFPEDREALNEACRRKEPLKAQGDSYEKLIGKQFEKNGDLVIYNGFIKGFEDRGVDIIVISDKTKTVNLVQCKNWQRRSFTLEDIENVYAKLDNYRPDFYSLEPEDINFYLDTPRDKRTIFSLLEYGVDYTRRKTLYIASDKVVDLEIGQHLTMMAPNIFRYEDMKMVVKAMN